MEIKIPGVRKLRERKDRGDPLWAATERPHLTIIMNNLLKALSQQATLSGMITMLGLLEWKTDTEMCERSGQPVVTSWGTTRESQSSFFHEKTQHDGTAQSIVNEVIPRDRPGRPVVDPQRGARPQQFIIGNDETESELSVESRSFLNRVNDQVGKGRNDFQMLQKMEKNILLGNGHYCNNGISSIHGKTYLNNCHITNTKDLTLKHMIDISTRLVSEQNEISGLKTIGWENHSWKYSYLICDERVINLQRTKVYVFSDSVLCLGKIFENPESNDAWEQRLGWIKSSLNYRNFDRIDGEPMDFEWNIFPGFNTLQLSQEVKSLLLRLGETPENFTGRILFVSMFNGISCGSRDNEEECLLNAKLVSLYAKRFGKGQWSFIGPGSEKKWYCISEDSPQGEWDNMAERMLLEFRRKWTSNFPCCKSIVQKSTQKQRTWKTVDSFGATQETIETIFRISASANQLSLYGAVAEMCAEYETLRERSGRPVVMGQSSSSLMLSVIKTEVPLDCDDLENQKYFIATVWRTN